MLINFFCAKDMREREREIFFKDEFQTQGVREFTFITRW